MNKRLGKTRDDAAEPQGSTRERSALDDLDEETSSHRHPSPPESPRPRSSPAPPILLQSWRSVRGNLRFVPARAASGSTSSLRARLARVKRRSPTSPRAQPLEP